MPKKEEKKTEKEIDVKKNELLLAARAILADIDAKKIELPKEVAADTPQADEHLRKARSITDQIKQKRYAA